MADELNLDVDAPTGWPASSAPRPIYQASAVELTAAWHDQRVPMIWAAIAGELDLAAWKLGCVPGGVFAFRAEAGNPRRQLFGSVGGLQRGEVKHRAISRSSSS